MNWESTGRYISIIATIVAVIALALTLTIVVDYYKRLDKIEKVKVETLEDVVAGASSSDVEQITKLIAAVAESLQMADLIEKKKRRLLNLPSISLHYCDKVRVKNFYNDYFREPTTENLVNEVVTEASGETGAKFLEVLESKVGTKGVSKWVKTIKLPETSISGMFRRYQRETIEKGQVSLDLDVVDIELSTVDGFEKAISSMRDKYNFKFDKKQLAEKKKELTSLSAEKILKRLESSYGATIIEGNFKITELNEKYYKCVYTHPVNDYLAHTESQITISVLLPKTEIEPFVAGNYAQSIGKAIPLRVYGEVWAPIDRSNNVFELQVTPLAVY